jgi:hypothetical protein
MRFRVIYLATDGRRRIALVVYANERELRRAWAEIWPDRKILQISKMTS